VGTISGAGDVDVYDLGPIEPGDHIVATMTTDATLDGALGLFDESGTALLVDDHRNVYLGRAEPLIDVVARRASSACYLAVAATPGYAGQGGYALTLSKRTILTIPPPQPDTILLVFSGGRDVRIGNRPSVDVPPFESEGISGTFAGRTDSMTAEIVARVRKDYQGFHVEILSTSEGDAFEPGMSRVFFGTYDDGLLGIAQGVDEFNSIKGQSAVVFTDTFEAFMVLHPTATEMSQALANVASHEIGHLLGLVHTSDPAGIMDVTASLVELTRDQQFRLSPIYEEVFPLGFQDEVRSLLDNVGGDFEIVAAAKPHSGRDPVRSRERLDEAARARWPLSSCGLCAVETP
jgi:predicted Zn-dependent protease